jgi:hypothetical protein
MQVRRHRTVLAIVAVGLLLCLGAVGFNYAIDLWESRALNQLATQLGIEPSWHRYERYLNESFTVGLTRQEVLAEAAKVGPHTVTPMVAENAEKIVFDFVAMGFPPLINKEHSWLIVYYDDAGIVIDIYRYNPREW